MVKYNEQALNAIFSALADGTRRGILARLALEDLPVTEIAAPYDMSLAAVSKHLTVLAKANLIVQHKEGRIRRCKLTPEGMRQAAEWVDYYRQFWNSKLDALEGFIDSFSDQSESKNHASKGEEEC